MLPEINTVDDVIGVLRHLHLRHTVDCFACTDHISQCSSDFGRKCTSFCDIADQFIVCISALQSRAEFRKGGA